jgi:hypothetical protein
LRTSYKLAPRATKSYDVLATASYETEPTTEQTAVTRKPELLAVGLL